MLNKNIFRALALISALIAHVSFAGVITTFDDGGLLEGQRVDGSDHVLSFSIVDDLAGLGLSMSNVNVTSAWLSFAIIDDNDDPLINTGNVTTDYVASSGGVDWYRTNTNYFDRETETANISVDGVYTGSLSQHPNPITTTTFVRRESIVQRDCSTNPFVVNCQISDILHTDFYNHVTEYRLASFSLTQSVLPSIIADGFVNVNLDSVYGDYVVQTARVHVNYDILPAASSPNANAVPEPSAIALMGLGLLGFVATRRKIKK